MKGSNRIPISFRVYLPTIQSRYLATLCGPTKSVVNNSFFLPRANRRVDPFSFPYRLLGTLAACRGQITDGVSPVELRSITPQGGDAIALPFGRPRGLNPVVDIT